MAIIQAIKGGILALYLSAIDGINDISQNITPLEKFFLLQSKNYLSILIKDFIKFHQMDIYPGNSRHKKSTGLEISIKPFCI